MFASGVAAGEFPCEECEDFVESVAWLWFNWFGLDDFEASSLEFWFCNDCCLLSCWSGVNALFPQSHNCWYTVDAIVHTLPGAKLSTGQRLSDELRQQVEKFGCLLWLSLSSAKMSSESGWSLEARETFSSIQAVINECDVPANCQHFRSDGGAWIGVELMSVTQYE